MLVGNITSYSIQTRAKEFVHHATPESKWLVLQKPNRKTVDPIVSLTGDATRKYSTNHGPYWFCFAPRFGHHLLDKRVSGAPETNQASPHDCHARGVHGNLGYARGCSTIRS